MHKREIYFVEVTWKFIDYGKMKSLLDTTKSINMYHESVSRKQSVAVFE